MIRDKLRSLIGRSNGTIIEVGANDGTDTAKLLDIVPYGDVFAFEPDPRAIKRFKEIVTSERIHLIECAVGASVGTVQFYQSGGLWPHGEEERTLQNLPEDWDQSGSIRKPKEHLEKHPWVTFDKKIDVPIVTLDSWTFDHRIKLIDLLWADVQGAEMDLIAGASDTLRNTRFFYTEYSDTELYEGAPRLDDISSEIPDFELLETFEDNALFRNKRWAGLLS